MRFGKSQLLTFGFVAAATLAAVSGQEKKKIEKVTYDDHVRPILMQKCFSCHNPDKKSGDLDLTNYINLMQGGGSGEVIEPGDSASSYLYSLMTHESEPFMPPESPKLPDKTIEIVRKWIDGGALENKGSKAMIKKKPKVNLAMAVSDSARPKVPPMPARLSLQPITTTTTTTAVSAIATNPWSKLAAIGSHKQVLLYRTDTSEFLGALAFPEGIPHVLKFSRNGQLLLAGGGRGGASGKVVLWNVKTTERVITVGEELDAVLAADISSDHSMVALGGPQKVVRIYSTETGQLMHELRKHTDWIYSLEFSPDGVLLATGDRAGNVFVWEGWTGREYLVLKGHGGSVTGISWRADSNVVATASLDTNIRLWEMENGGNIRRWGAHGGGVSDIEFARDGRIASIGRDRVVKLWDQAGKQQRAFEAFGDLGLKVSFCDETNRVIGGDWNGQIRSWEAKDGKRVADLAQSPNRLKDRLQAANAALAAKQKAHAPVDAAFKGADKAMKDAVSKAGAATKTLAASQAALTKLKGEITAATKAKTAAMAAHKSSTENSAKLTKAIPVLKDLVAKAEAAAKQVPADKELAASAKKLKEINARKGKELEAAKADVVAKKAALDKAAAVVVAKTKAMTDETTKNKTYAKNVTTTKAAAAATKKAYDAAKANFDKSAAELAAVATSVTKWNAEIEFDGKLSKLVAQRSAVEKTLNDEQDVLVDALTLVENQKKEMNGLTTQMATDKMAYDTAVTNRKSGLAKLNQAKQLAATRQAEIAALNTSSAEITAALPGVEKGYTTIVGASAKAKGDKELAAAVEQLATLIAKKKKQIVTNKTTAATKDKEMKAALATVTAQTKAATEYAKQMDSHKLKMEKLAADMAAKQKQVEKSIGESEIVKKKVEGIEKQLSAVKASIATLRGLN